MADEAMKRHWDSANELVGVEPPTADDVPITLDGDRLDSPEKVRKFVDTMNADRRE